MAGNQCFAVLYGSAIAQQRVQLVGNLGLGEQARRRKRRRRCCGQRKRLAHARVEVDRRGIGFPDQCDGRRTGVEDRRQQRAVGLEVARAFDHTGLERPVRIAQAVGQRGVGDLCRARAPQQHAQSNHQQADRGRALPEALDQAGSGQIALGVEVLLRRGHQDARGAAQRTEALGLRSRLVTRQQTRLFAGPQSVGECLLDRLPGLCMPRQLQVEHAVLAHRSDLAGEQLEFSLEAVLAGLRQGRLGRCSGDALDGIVCLIDVPQRLTCPGARELADFAHRADRHEDRGGHE